MLFYMLAVHMPCRLHATNVPLHLPIFSCQKLSLLEDLPKEPFHCMAESADSQYRLTAAGGHLSRCT